MSDKVLFEDHSGKHEDIKITDQDVYIGDRTCPLQDVDYAMRKVDRVQPISGFLVNGAFVIGGGMLVLSFPTSLIAWVIALCVIALGVYNFKSILEGELHFLIVVTKTADENLVAVREYGQGKEIVRQAYDALGEAQARTTAATDQAAALSSDANDEKLDLLSEAIRDGDPERVRALVNDGVSINAKGFLILFSASMRGNPEVIKVLLEAGADVNGCQGDQTPLMAAVLWNTDARAVRTLMQAGADVNRATAKGHTPLMFASDGGKTDIVRCLLKAGAEVEAKEEEGRTALISAAWEGKRGTVRALLEGGADANARTTRGDTALMGAASNGHAGIVMLLLQHGADKNAANDTGLSAQHFADEHPEILQLLQDYPDVAGFEPTSESFMREIDGELIPEDLLAAAEGGDMEAQYTLGCMYNDDCGSGISKNHTRAVEWYFKAASQGHPAAASFLGYLYEWGTGVDQSWSEAARWYRESAEKGYDIGQYSLGLMYLKGKGVPKDEALGVQYIRQAADQGYQVAQANLGRCFATGCGVVRDDAEAVVWYSKAAKQGGPEAKAAIQRMREQGLISSEVGKDSSG